VADVLVVHPVGQIRVVEDGRVADEAGSGEGLRCIVEAEPGAFVFVGRERVVVGGTERVGFGPVREAVEIGIGEGGSGADGSFPSVREAVPVGIDRVRAGEELVEVGEAVAVEIVSGEHVGVGEEGVVGAVMDEDTFPGIVQTVAIHVAVGEEGIGAAGELGGVGEAVPVEVPFRKHMLDGGEGVVGMGVEDGAFERVGEPLWAPSSLGRV
jgi:hypothetical protein